MVSKKNKQKRAFLKNLDNYISNIGYNNLKQNPYTEPSHLSDYKAYLEHIKTIPIKSNVLPLFINKNSIKRIGYIHENINKLFDLSNRNKPLSPYTAKLINTHIFDSVSEYKAHNSTLKTIFDMDSLNYFVAFNTAKSFNRIDRTEYKPYTQKDYNIDISNQFKKSLLSSYQ